MGYFSTTISVLLEETRTRNAWGHDETERDEHHSLVDQMMIKHQEAILIEDYRDITAMNY